VSGWQPAEVRSVLRYATDLKSELATVYTVDGDVVAQCMDRGWAQALVAAWNEGREVT